MKILRRLGVEFCLSPSSLGILQTQLRTSLKTLWTPQQYGTEVFEGDFNFTLITFFTNFRNSQRPGNSSALRRTAFRGTAFSRHHVDSIKAPWKPFQHHSNMVPRCLRGPSVLLQLGLTGNWCEHFSCGWKWLKFEVWKTAPNLPDDLVDSNCLQKNVKLCLWEKGEIERWERHSI